MPLKPTFPTSDSTGAPAPVNPSKATRSSAVKGRVQNVGTVPYHAIEDMDFDLGTNGFHTVDEPHTLYVNCRFTSRGEPSNTGALVQPQGYGNLVIFLNCTFDGGPQYVRGCQSDTAHMIFGGCRFHNTGEAAVEKNDRQGKSDIWITGCYASNDKGWLRGQHVDGFQIGSARNVLIENSTVLNPCYGGKEGDTGYVSNSALGLWAELGDVTGLVRVRKCLLAGGGATIYAEEKSPDKFRAAVVIEDNVFDTRYSPRVGIWGALADLNLPDRFTWQRNTYSDGRPLTLADALTK